MAKTKRNSASSKSGDFHYCDTLRSLLLLGLAAGAVFLLSHTSPRGDQGNDVTTASSLGQRQTTEGSGRTFQLHLASLTGGTKGEVVIQTHPEWAPLGVAHFHDLMDRGFYRDAKFFRVVDNFITQWGLAADPHQFPQEQDHAIPDDPVKQTNRRGTISFATAGPDTRTTQLFVNTRKDGNQFLDEQGFSPIAEVISGMEYIDEIYAGYGEEPSQGQIKIDGNAYLDQNYPSLSFIESTQAMEADDGTKEDKGGDN